MIHDALEWGIGAIEAAEAITVELLKVVYTITGSTIDATAFDIHSTLYTIHIQWQHYQQALVHTLNINKTK